MSFDYSRKELADIAHNVFLVLDTHNISSIDKLSDYLNQDIHVSSRNYVSITMQRYDLESLCYSISYKDTLDVWAVSPLIIDLNISLEKLRTTIECKEIILSYNLWTATTKDTFVQRKEVDCQDISTLFDELRSLSKISNKMKKKNL
ncbi:MAG: hypothetical protein AABW65_01335 [Nanoarchaeota archaeon]